MNVRHTQTVAQLEEEIARLEASLPRHSTPPAMLIRLEELEEALAAARARAALERENRSDV